ncbi:MAG TPA: anti-sigma regulatory factor [Bacillota bacterium]|nr:anti-sigma regulatory factor [Bacillota bacterium]
MVHRLPISCEQDIVEARRVARKAAGEAGFNQVDSCRVVVSLSELARNILFYAKVGTVMIRTIDEDERTGIEILAEDRGPGIPDTQSATLDGFTTSQRLGKGLPAARRLMDEFRLDSTPGVGTLVIVRKWVNY